MEINSLSACTSSIQQSEKSHLSAEPLSQRPAPASLPAINYASSVVYRRLFLSLSPLFVTRAYRFRQGVERDHRVSVFLPLPASRAIVIDAGR